MKLNGKLDAKFPKAHS